MRSVPGPAYTLLLLAALGLAACGGDDSLDTGGADEATAEETTAREPGATASAEGRPFGTANSLELTAAGGAEAELAFDGREITMAGGCDGDSRASLGFRAGNHTEPGYFSFGFDTEGVIASGATGTFPLEEIRWDDGVREETVGGRTISVPNRWAGSGSLTLETHTATLTERRMVGTVTGEVLRDDADDPTQITAEFDVNFSCGVL